MKLIAFVVNSTIRKVDAKVEKIKTFFDDEKYQLAFYFSEKSRHIEDLTQQAIKDGYRYIIFVGGDGTLNEGINGLLQAVKKSAHTEKEAILNYDLALLQQYKVGILPLGSGNDFAKTIQQTHSVESLKQKIDNENFQTIDIGLMQYENEQRQASTRFFINIADVGIGGVVSKKIVNKNNALNPNWIYLKAIFTTMLSYKNQMVKFQSEKEQWQSKIKSLIFANGIFFGSGLGIAPKAKLNSGHFEIVKMGDISILDYIIHLRSLQKVRLIKHKEVSYSQAKQFSIAPADQQDLPIDMDGEFIGYAPLSVVCVPQAIQFIG